MARTAAAHRVPEPDSLDLEAFRERSLQKGVNPVVYRVIRALFLPFFLVYFRLQRIGREHLPRERAAAAGRPTTARSSIRS